MDNIKDAFQKVKRDMEFLYSEINSLRRELANTKENLLSITRILDKISKNSPQTGALREENNPTQDTLKETLPTHSSTDNTPSEPLKGLNIPFSTGNEGVPTDRQTDRQTNQQTENAHKVFEKIGENTIDSAARMLDSLDSIKKEIRLKFKRLTDQEILVFSTIYQIDEETGPTDYKAISTKLNLSESSIRDYVGRLIKKGIPVEKKRINNKTIQLSISQNLKKIASLPTILQLRDL